MTDRSAVILELAARIHSLKLHHPIRVAIDGIDGSGKTSLAHELVEPLTALGRQVIPASIDGFHRTRAERYHRGEESAEGYYRNSFDNTALVTALLGSLGPVGTRRYRTAVLDYRDDKPVTQRVETADQNAVLIFDGIFLLRPELVHPWDLTVFLKSSFATALERVVSRDAPMFGSSCAARKRCETRYQPGQRLYFAEAKPEQLANVMVSNDELSKPTLVSRP